jgi:hypothetical protein
MGGAVSAVGDLVGGVGGAVGSVVNQIPGIGPIAGPLISGYYGGPLGFASSLGSNALQGNYGGGGGGGGGGGTPSYAKPGIDYGNNTYQYGGKPLDTSPYFITGDKGVYNLLPALGQINAGQESSLYRTNRLNNDNRIEKFNALGAANAYTPYEAYQDIQAQMANDPTALAAFNKAYRPSTMGSSNIKLPAILGGHNIPIGGPSPDTPLGQFHATTPNPYGQYVNFGLKKALPSESSTNPNSYYSDLAKYAAENKNPFFLPFETAQGATPLGFTPSQNALGAIDSSPYLSGLSTATTTHNQFVSDQQKAARAAQEAQREAQRQAQEQARRAEQRARDAQRQARDQAQAQDRAREQAEDQQKRLQNRLQGPRGNDGLTSVRPPSVTPNFGAFTPPSRNNNPAPATPAAPIVNNLFTPGKPTPVAPTPVAPTPVTPPPPPGPGSFTPMARGGIAMLRRR